MGEVSWEGEARARGERGVEDDEERSARMIGCWACERAEKWW